MDELITEPERGALVECEAVIERGLKTFYEVGTALLKIRDERLYRADYATFEDYCRDRWQWSKTHVNRQIEAAQAVQNLTPIGVKPQNEAQVRPLTQLEPEQQREAWNVAVSQSANGTPTAREVEHVVRTMKPQPTPAEIASELRARQAENQVAKMMRERGEAELRRYSTYSRLVESTKFLANFHLRSVAEIWDGISNTHEYAYGDDTYMDDLKKAVKFLTRLEREHPNAMRKPGIVQKIGNDAS